MPPSSVVATWRRPWQVSLENDRRDLVSAEVRDCQYWQTSNRLTGALGPRHGYSSSTVPDPSPFNTRAYPTAESADAVEVRQLRRQVTITKQSVGNWAWRIRPSCRDIL